MNSNFQIFRNKILPIIVIFVIANILWFVYVIPEENALSKDYQRYVSYEGNDRMVESYGGELGDLFYIKELSTEKVVNVEGNVLEIVTDIEAYDVTSDDPFFVYSDTYFVDRFTKKLVDNPDVYYAFPHHVEQKDYDFDHPFVQRPAKLSFSGTETIQKLDTYIFTCSLTVDNSEAFPAFSSREIFADYSCKLWVEPETGDVVKFQLNWENHFIENGEKVHVVEIGGLSTTEYASTLAIEVAKQKIEKLIVYESIIPIIMIAVAITAIVIRLILARIAIEREKSEEKSQRELLKAKERRIEEVLYETIPNPVVAFDKNDKFVNCNKIFLEKVGYSKDEITKMYAHDFLFEEDKKTFRDVIKPSLIRGEFFEDLDLNIKKQDGTAFHGLWSHVRLFDDSDEYTGFTAIASDLTEVDRLQNELAKEKEEFVAMITHDLKQPLVPIQGNAELLKNPKMGELNEMQKDCVEEIQANASRQLSMIDNLVSAQKLGAGAMKYNIEELPSKAILAECIKTHSPVMGDKNLEYFESSTEDIKIKGDHRRIVESFTNLILNAHDFVPENGKIEIGVTNGEKEVTFFCKDNGEGIPKEKQDQLFKKYGQVKSGAKRKFGGTGLGLAVSQELVEGMGGKIWLESEEGKGATFFFTIPKA